jgi:hypothetical protein
MLCKRIISEGQIRSWVDKEETVEGYPNGKEYKTLLAFVPKSDLIEASDDGCCETLSKHKLSLGA